MSVTAEQLAHWLTLDEVAALLKVSHRTVQRLVSPAAGKDRLVATRFGGSTREADDAGELAEGEGALMKGRDWRGAVGSPGSPNWPDMDGLEHCDTVTDFTLPEGTFFEVAMVLY